jgi:hypothetical protein
MAATMAATTMTTAIAPSTTMATTMAPRRMTTNDDRPPVLAFFCVLQALASCCSGFVAFHLLARAAGGAPDQWSMRSL